MTNAVPGWLFTMRAITGTRETPGGADNPVILGWRDEIARRFPDLASYARAYQKDATPWCGLTVAYVMAANGIKPPSTFLWARSWAAWGTATTPRPGAVMVFSRDGGGHVALYESEDNTHYTVRGGNQGDAVSVARYERARLLSARWPVASAAVDLDEVKPSSQAPLAGVGRSTDPSTMSLRMDIPKSAGPASIRYNNPGAQWPSERAARFGQIGYGQLADGLNAGAGNKIARFPHPVNGAASNFDLLARLYVGMKIGAAGVKWTGANGFGVPGYDPDTVLTRALIDDADTAIAFLKAIAKREAGKDSPLTDEQWRAAHAMFRAGSADAWLAGQGAEITATKSANRTKIAAGAAAGATGSAIAAGGAMVAASQQGWGPLEWSLLVAGLAAAAVAGWLAWRWWQRRKVASQIPTIIRTDEE
jgi:uncharacterized protein (TIGR02594 family)